MKDKHQLLQGSAGTYHFMAPEVCKRARPEGYDGRQSDIWSFGCTLYTLAYQQPPFTGESLIELFQTIEKGEYFNVTPDGNSWITSER